ncbi:hypothetical protein EJ05DRAFT_116927 [Pseudovirgaria hyperparasitica]|uniref:Myb-like domain-containing protein n=1 Tax=Pseudovirgaria hyperparasitica TaxID=470096 RepID=A0A6A6VYN5_9PEZI|nr:uncharacterized protein EJ05DRAFT_116927 [Pseudovirgaria hyperparasitica]KAF2754946.1 hypothetical protein EJ05DRAFT_116927 [Pseudovirgaria hyperparasitica]
MSVSHRSQSPTSKRGAKTTPMTPAAQNLTSASATEPQGVRPLAPASAAGSHEALDLASPTNRKRRASGEYPSSTVPGPSSMAPSQASSSAPPGPASGGTELERPIQPSPAKKGRTNTPWTAAEEQRLKQMRDQGLSWNEIAKSFPARTEGSVKKHWYKDMHYAEFAENESAALLAAIKEYEANKWKSIGAKVGKPAKACEQYAKEHFGGKF